MVGLLCQTLLYNAIWTPATIKRQEFCGSNTILKLRYAISNSFWSLLKYIFLCLFKMDKYVVYADWIINGMPTEPYEFIKRLEKYDWTLISLSRLDNKFFDDKKCIILCVTYREVNIAFLKTKNTVVIYKIDDLFPFFDIYAKCINACDYIIGSYTYLFSTIPHVSLNTKQSLWLLWSAVPEFYENINFNNDPVNKVLVSGAVSFHYPLRHFISTNSIFSEYIEILVHPGYVQDGRPFSHDIMRDRYYHKLNEYICCFCDSLLHKYIVPKVFEITSIGALLLAEDKIESVLNEIGFYNNINCILCNKTNLLAKIRWILDDKNRSEVDIMRRNGMELTRDYHTTDNRIAKFNNFIDSIASADKMTRFK